MSDKIGVAVTTYKRPDYFTRCIETIPTVDTLIVVNDGTPYDNKVYPSKIKEVITHNRNLGIACAKNSAMRALMQDGCDWIFVLEDDMLIKDPNVFETYIKACNKSGIYHMNYGFSNIYNYNKDGYRVIRNTVDYGDGVNVNFLYNVMAGFSVTLRGVIKAVGYMDERYTLFNNMEHVDHTMRIISKGLHPPFGYFADIDKSWEMLEVIPESIQNSTIPKTADFSQKFSLACQLFKHNWGYLPQDVPQTKPEDALKIIEGIQENYARK